MRTNVNDSSPPAFRAIFNIMVGAASVFAREGVAKAGVLIEISGEVWHGLVWAVPPDGSVVIVGGSDDLQHAYQDLDPLLCGQLMPPEGSDENPVSAVLGSNGAVLVFSGVVQPPTSGGTA